MSIHGSGYLKLQIDEREAEIARLRSDLAVEKINNKRLQSERNNAEGEIARLQAEEANDAQTIKSHADTIRRLQEQLRGTGANRYWEGRWRDADAENQKLQAALEASRTAYQRIDCTPSSIIAAIELALAKEGK